ncbi:MAG: 50S ribosomal protein L9 [Saprospiraceae bacterium]|nr:50S ribosomal protein L9 [Saprospiraceae bacterium]
MEVILLDHIEKVGAKHEVVKVRDGYGRNYLIPQGLAIVANKSNLAQLEGMRKQAAKKEEAVVAAFREVADKLKGIALRIAAKAGDSGRLFGSVTASHIADAMKARGVDAEKRIIEMPDEVKELGKYTAIVKFHPQVVVELPFEVVSEEEGD